MNCPYCGDNDLKVIDSRESKDGLGIKRRRECMSCKKRFSTIEKILKLELEVRKQNGQKETFNILKLKNSLIKACDKRPITLEQIDSLLNKILGEIKRLNEKSIETIEIGRIALKNLKDVDEISFLKYAIVYNKYDTLDDFNKSIKKLMNL